MNQYGSNGDGKACKNCYAMAVLPPDADADTPMWILTTSPTAMKGFEGYVSSVARVFETSPVGVITTVGFDPNQTYAKLMFGNAEALSDEALGVFFGRMDEAKQMLAAEPDVSGYVAKPKAKGRR